MPLSAEHAETLPNMSNSFVLHGTVSVENFLVQITAQIFGHLSVEDNRYNYIIGKWKRILTSKNLCEKNQQIMAVCS